MRLFTVRATSVIAGFRVHLDPYQHVRMGEPGEHETALWIPLAPREWTGDERRISRASAKLVGTKPKQTLMLSPQSDELDKHVEDNALVLVDIRGRVDGETSWTTARTAPRPCPMQGQSMGTPECPLCLARQSGRKHPLKGAFRDYGAFPPHGVHIVRKGFIRSKGSHPTHPNLAAPPWTQVYLLRMKPGAIFRVHRGYDKGVANERLIRWTGEAIELGTKSEILEERIETAPEI